MPDLITLHRGPADGVTYELREGDPLPEEVELTVPVGIPTVEPRDLPNMVVRGDVRAVYRYRRTGGTRDYYWQPVYANLFGPGPKEAGR